MEEILSDNELEEINIISDSDSDSDEINDEPVIIRPHKHNLRKKTKKINYNESAKKSHNIPEETSQSAKPDEIIKRVLKTIILLLNHYWKEPNPNALISTILDPRHKDLSFLSDEELKIRTEVNLQNIYDNLNFELNPNEELSNVLTTTSTIKEDSIFSTLYGVEKQRKRNSNEVDVYLNENLTEKAAPSINPFEWWNFNKQRFPILAILARKYLSIPATSVPNKRLFSDAGNNMTNKRTHLNPKFFQEILYVKRNSKYIDMFTLLSNKVNIIEYFTFF